MDFIVLGGDARMPALAELLREHGFTVRHTKAPTAEVLAGANNVAVNCPPKCGVTMEELLALTRSDARIWLCGPAGWDDKRTIDLWRDETLLRDNAHLTAEGAVCAAMKASRKCLRDMRCMVIGWGRIGGALTKMLVALGAKVTVISRCEVHRHCAIERGAEAASMEALPQVLPDIDLVFNTAPALVLDGEALRSANRSAMLIDLASPPYGIDLRSAWNLGLRAWREPALPGRYCPDSAAEALCRAILRGGARHA